MITIKDMNKRSVIILALLFLLVGSIPLNAQWTALQGPPGASVSDIERTSVANNLLLLTNQKLFRTTNNGDSWQEVATVTPNVGFDDILVAGTTIYGLNYSQFWKSTDGGINWIKQSTDGAFYGVRRMIRFGPDNFLAIYGWNGIFVSKDEGVTWIRASSSETYSVAANAAGDLYSTRFVDKANPAPDEAQIIRYLYPGAAGTYTEANWQVVYTDFTEPYTYYMFLYVSAAGKIFATITGDVLASTTGNAGTWTSTRGPVISPTLTETNFYEANWAQVGTTITLSSYYGSKIWTTNDAGATWVGTNPPTADFGSQITKFVYGATNATAFVASTSDGVFRSDNANVLVTPTPTWTLKSNGLLFGTGRQIEVSATGRIIYINNYQSKGYWTSTDNGANWSFVSLPQAVQYISKLSDNKIILFGGSSVYRSDNDGALFTDVEPQYFGSIVEDGAGNLIGSTGSTILKSTDKGTTWAAYAPAITGLPTSMNMQFMAIDNTNGRLYFWLYDYNTSTYKLLKVPTAGGAVTQITEDPWNDDSNINVNNMFLSNGKVYVAEYNAFYESTDEGATWKTIGFSGDRVFPIAGGLCVSKYGSLYVTQDGGQSWNSTTLPNSNSFIYDITPVAGGFMAATTNSPALKFTGNLILPVDQLPPYIDFSWQSTDGPYGGSLNKVLTDNTSTYVPSNGKLYKTTTFSSWSEVALPGTEYINDLAIDKPNNTLYAMIYNKILRSTNGGTTWTDWNTEAIDCRNQLIRAANGTMVMMSYCSEQKIYVSTNNGATFGTEKYSVDTNEKYIESVNISSTGVILLTVYDYDLSTYTWLKSSNNGTTWDPVTLPVSYAYKFAADNVGNIYVWQNLNLHRSSDNGATWTNISGDINTLGGGNIDYYNSVYTAPSGDLWFNGYNDTQGKYGFYKTANNGTNWTFIPLNVRPTSVTTAGASRIVVSTEDGIYTSDDNGTTWVYRSTGIVAHNFVDVEAVGPNKVITLTNGDRAFQTSNSQTWTAVPGFQGRKFYKNPDGSTYAYNSNSIFKTYDNGLTWSKFAYFPGYLDYLATANGTLYFGAGGEDIKYTLDFVTWTNLSVAGFPTEYYIYSLAVSPLGAVFVVIYNYSTNKYESYQILFGSAIKFDKPVYPRSVFYDYEDEVIRLYDAQGVIYQTADGTTWTSRSAPAGEKLIVAQKGYYFIPIYGGVLWLSRNEGQTWQSVGLSTFNSNATFQDVTINEFTGLAFGAISNSVIRKSGNIVLPPETSVPVATELSPLDNSTGASVKPLLSITFDEAVTPVAGKTIRILDSANPISPIETMDVTAGVVKDKVITFQASNVLQFNKSYFVIWDAGAFVDVFDNEIVGLSSPTAWNFTTKAGPTFSSTTPANNGTGVGIQPVLTATFSEPMAPVNAKNLRVFKVSDPANAIATVALQPLSAEFVSFVPANPIAGQPVKVRFDATKGQGNLIGAPKVYMRSAVVLTDLADPAYGNLSNFRYTEMTKVAGEANIWELSLSPTLRQFFGVGVGVPIYDVGLQFENEGGSIDAIPLGTIANGTVNSGTVFLNVASGTTPACSTLPTSSGNSLNFSLCVNLEYSTQYFAKFDAASFVTADGGALTALTANTDWVFTTEAPPAVLAVTPAHNAVSIANNTQLQITFASPVTPIAGKKLYVNTSAGVARTINMETGTVSGSTITWSITPALPYETQFNVTTDAGSFMGLNVFSKFQANTDWVFTTQNSPAVTTLLPADDATGVALTTNLVITFASSINLEASKNLTIHKASDDAVVATIPTNTATVAGNAYTFTVPASTLQFNTAYYVMTDANSFSALTTFSKFQNKTDWSFTTMPAPDLVAPTISYTAANFARGAQNKLTITVTDNASGSGVDPASVKVNYRGISVTTATLSAPMQPGTAANTFEVAVPDAWLDELGLEFSFEAKDVNTNTGVSPATGYHRANVTYPETSSLTLPSTVLSAGGGEQNYRIISIPHTLANANIADVFNEVLIGNETEVRLLTYNTSTSAYIEAPDGFAAFTRGVGYWINIKEPTTIVLESATTPNNSKDSPFVLKLKAGWNQIGNPYPFTISWDAVKAAAANANIGVLKTWNGNSYATDAKLNAFEGGFVFFNGTGEVNVNIPLSAKTTPGRAAYEPDFGSGWLLPLKVSNGKFENNLGGIGMHADANLSYDQFDDMPLPAFISMPEMKFPHAEHAMKNFTRDIVPVQNSFVWEFNLDPASDVAVLTWDPALIAGKANELWLFDESEQKMVNMLTENQYTLYSGKITKFKVYYGFGQDDIMPTRISLGKPFPNPVVSVSRVNFTLPERNTSPYQVSLDVFDLMGRKVRTLAEGEFSPGFYEAEWTLKGGEASVSGVYFYKLTVINTSDNVVLTQKVIFNK
jgi:photosystem II stability/assembly factor-like uncharacterized protein